MYTFAISYCEAVVATLGAALGLLSAFLWRDLIIGVLKRYEIWDNEKGLETGRDIWIVSLVAMGVTIITAGVVVMGKSLCSDNNTKITIKRR